MRRWAPWLLAALAGAVLVHVAVLHAVPRMIMSAVLRGVGAQFGVNTAAFPPRADASARTIVRPSPDLLYSLCAFDVSDGPVRVSATVPEDTYWSVALFSANTDNFFALNDRQVASGAGADGRQVELVLAPAGSAVDVPPGATLVETPTAQGLVLTRTLITDESRLAALDTARRAFRCGRL